MRLIDNGFRPADIGLAGFHKHIRCYHNRLGHKLGAVPVVHVEISIGVIADGVAIEGIVPLDIA